MHCYFHCLCLEKGSDPLSDPLSLALAHNLMRTLALAPHLLGYGRGASAEPAMET